MAAHPFPRISDSKLRELLEPPSGRVRVVIDADTKNEIDDQFAIAWALLSQEKLKIEGVYAAPFSFQYRLQELRRAYDAQSAPAQASAEDRNLVARYQRQIRDLQAQGVTPHDLSLDGPDVGMQRSHEENRIVFELLNVDPDGKIYPGSRQYLPSLDNPLRTPAAEHLIERALATDESQPLYVVAIGCVTNVASALLLAPEIIDRIVVTWTAGYPTTVTRPNYSFNLEQDMLASQLMFESGVPLVYLPGFHIGAQLRLSLPEMETYVRGKGKIGDFLYSLYTNFPLQAHFGAINPVDGARVISDHVGYTKIIWDLINIAWLLNPEWVPSEIVPTSILGDDKCWHRPASGAHVIREAFDIDRDAMFRDFFAKLDKAP